MRVAHVGNSIQYYGDTPRVLEQMLRLRYETVEQSQMLRSAATLKSMFRDGQDLEGRYNVDVATLPDGTLDLGAETVPELFSMHGGLWQYVVLNDRTTHPATPDTRADSIEWLETSYVPIFPPTATALWIQTPPDRIEDNRDSTVGLGPFDEFLASTTEGYEAYRDVFLANGVPSTVVPVGTAYGLVNSTYGPDLFQKLYSPDDFHPSVFGTYLQCALLYCVITGEDPPTLDNTWFSRSRYLEVRDAYELPYYMIPFPSVEEAEQLRQVAIGACGVK